MGYEDTFIYVMHFNTVFQYLFSWYGEIYQRHIIVKPPLWRRLAHALQLLPLYAPEQMEYAEGVILSGAMASIDELKKLGIKKVKHLRKKAEEKASECVWQVRTAMDNKMPLYHCVKHNVDREMIKGIPPRHM